MYFQIDGSNLRIAGSLHAFPPNSPSIPQWLCEAYEWCEQLVFEHENSQVFSRMHFSDGKKLEPLISPDAWQFLRTIWPTDGPLSPLNTIKPWAAMLVAPAFVVPTAVGVEIQLLNWAARNGKPVYWLESAEDLASAMESIPISSIDHVILRIQNEVDLIRENFAGLYAAWSNSDLNSVYALVKNTGIFADEKVKGAILTTRNHAWFNTIRGAIRPAKRTLVVIGALHLFGENNIAELIEKDGNSISLINS